MFQIKLLKHNFRLLYSLLVYRDIYKCIPVSVIVQWKMYLAFVLQWKRATEESGGIISQGNLLHLLPMHRIIMEFLILFGHKS